MICQIFDGFMGEMDDLKRLGSKNFWPMMENLVQKNMNGLKLYLEDDYDNLLKFQSLWCKYCIQNTWNVEYIKRVFRVIKKPRRNILLLYGTMKK